MKCFFLSSVLKTVGLLTIFIETVMHFFSFFAKEDNLYEREIICNFINVFNIILINSMHLCCIKVKKNP